MGLSDAKETYTNLIKNGSSCFGFSKHSCHTLAKVISTIQITLETGVAFELRCSTDKSFIMMHSESHKN